MQPIEINKHQFFKIELLEVPISRVLGYKMGNGNLTNERLREIRDLILIMNYKPK